MTLPKLKRIAPGYYETRDGKWQVCKVVYDYNGETAWFYRCTVPGHYFEEAHDHVSTKRQAVEWLAQAMIEYPA